MKVIRTLPFKRLSGKKISFANLWSWKPPFVKGIITKKWLFQIPQNNFFRSESERLTNHFLVDFFSVEDFKLQANIHIISCKWSTWGLNFRALWTLLLSVLTLKYSIKFSCNLISATKKTICGFEKRQHALFLNFQVALLKSKFSFFLIKDKSLKYWVAKLWNHLELWIWEMRYMEIIQ